jgi:phosphoadenosine phosphosulfate reductase
MQTKLHLEKEISEKRKRQCGKLIELSKEVVRKAFDTYSFQNIGATWTGGKDSGLTLWIIREICLERGLKLPKTMIIGEGDEFEEIEAFVNRTSREWDVPVEWCRNEDVLKAADHTLGKEVFVKDLNELNRVELQKLSFNEASFPFEAESFVGNHLMKTAVFQQWLKANNIQAVFQGLRWDEHPSRFNDLYFEEKVQEGDVPAHTRIRPILHFTERDLWDTYAFLNLPYCELYEKGYRSLGAKSTSNKDTDIPAWQQDLENTEEREGRHQEKEAVMDQLRALGYM